MHGDELETACDLKFQFSSANNLLLKLHPDLRAAFYRADETRDLVNPDHMPHFRFPLLGAITWELEIPRTRLRVHDAEDSAHDVVLGGGKTNKFKLVLKQGGTVEWSFRCQFSKPDEDAIAKLMRVLNQQVPITLECADEEEKLDNFEQAEQITKAPHSAAREEAESLFSAPPTDMSIANGTDEPTTPEAVVAAAVDEPEQEPETNVAPIKGRRGKSKQIAAPE
ncbi:MAG: hypothetical protein V4857_14185 [Pseudomonadota bacterium]